MTAAPAGLAVPRPAGRTSPVGDKPGFDLGFVFLVLFVFVSTSRIFDTLLPYLHIPFVLAVLAGLFMVPSGALARAFETNVAKLMALFTVWMLICVPFSMWRGGSVMMLQNMWSKSYVLLVMIAGMASTFGRVKKIIVTITYASLLVAVVALVRGDTVQGRLTMESGFLSNPNDLAQFLLVGLCFLPLLVNGKSSMLFRIPTAIAAIGMLYAIIATGSRATFLGLLILGFVVFFRASGIYRLGVLTVAVAALAAFFLLTPQSIQTRLSTLEGDGPSAATGNVDGIAAASAQSRRQLLIQSIRLTLKNPAFGVGPGVFQYASAEDSHESGEHAMWRESHNSFTQVSSESGIPGLALFLGANLACVAGLLRLWKRCKDKPQMQELRLQVNCLLLGFLAFVVTAVFASVAYQFNFCMMIGLAAATLGAAKRELDEAPAAAGAAIPTRTISYGFPRMGTPNMSVNMPAAASVGIPNPHLAGAARRVPSAPRYPQKGASSPRN